MSRLGDLSPQGTVAVGILVGLLSTSIQSLGLTLQRKSHILEDGKGEYEARRPAYKRRRWQLGMLMFLLSNIVGSTIQITTLPLPVLSTLQAAGLVFNTAFATLLLKEPFTRFSLLGTILTCAGAALIAVFGAVGEPAHNLSQLLDLLGRTQFILWMIGTMIIAVGTIISAHVLKVYSKRIYRDPTEPEAGRRRSRSFSISHPDLIGLRRSLTAQLPQPLQNRIARIRLIRGLTYALISGIFSAHSLLVAKSAVELLVRTILDHNNQFNRYQSWLILLALILFALPQLYYLHLGLRLCSTSVLYPFVFCIYNITAILDGLIYFHQSSRLSTLHVWLTALGTVVLLSGVFALSWRLDDTKPTDPAQQIAEPPPNPLTPGMGLIRTSEDAITSPLLPTARPRSSTSVSRHSVNEQTPLLSVRRQRRPNSSIYQPATDPDTKSIWAEFEDEMPGSEQDILVSLRRTPSTLLAQQQNFQRRSRRGISLPFVPLSSSGQSLPKTNVTGAGDPNISSRRQSKGARTLQLTAWKERRRSSAPSRTRGGKSPFRNSMLSLWGNRPVSSRIAREAEDDTNDEISNAQREEADVGERNRKWTILGPSRWSLGVPWWLQRKSSGKRKRRIDNHDDPGG